MPLSPNIPTSFVPKQQITQTPRHRSSGENLFVFLALILLVIVLAATGGVFAYDQYLKKTAADKAVEVETLQKTISTDSAQEYIRSRDRFSEADKILKTHLAISQFLSLLEKLTLQNVYFDSMHLTVNPDNSAKILLTGTARNFNALAAQSSAFSATNSPLKETIFSDITTSKTGLVSFSVSTSLDSTFLIMEKPAGGTVQQAQAPAPVEAPATTTATSTPVVNPATSTPAKPKTP